MHISRRSGFRLSLGSSREHCRRSSALSRSSHPNTGTRLNKFCSSTKASSRSLHWGRRVLFFLGRDRTTTPSTSQPATGKADTSILSNRDLVKVLSSWRQQRATSSNSPSQATETSPIQGPQIKKRTIFPISPRDVVALIGDGAGLTPHGSWRTTRRVMMRDEDAIAHKAEDAGLVRFAGRDKDGEILWIDIETGEFISKGRIRERWGSRLTELSGIRDLTRFPFRDPNRELAKELLMEGIRRLPVGSSERNRLVEQYEALSKHPIDSMVADFGGVVPDYMRDTLYKRMGMTAADLQGTRIGGTHHRNVLQPASDQTRLYLYGAIEVLNQLGGRLPDLYPHSRKVGFAFGAAFEAWDALLEMFDAHRQGKNFKGLNTPLPNALLSQPPAVLANMLGPEFNYTMAKKNPKLLDGIIPRNMNPQVGPDTLGPISTEVAACASGFYALAAGANALTRRLPGQWRPDIFIVGAADASLSPLATPGLITGFSEIAPMSRKTLNQLGILPAEASRPLLDDAGGLVVSEGAGAIAMTTLPQLILRRQLAGALLVGWGTSLGEGGKEMLMGMDAGNIAANLEAINMGIEGHGMSIEQIVAVMAHLTGTKLNNYAEMLAHLRTFQAYKAEHQPAIGAGKGDLGHTMGAASLLDLLNMVATLREQRIAPINNFSHDKIDKRYAKDGIDKFFEYPTQPITRHVEAVLGSTQGFGSRNASVLLRRFYTEILWHYDWPSDMKGKVADYISAWPDILGEYEERQADLRRGKITHGQLVLENAYPNRMLNSP